MNVLDPGHLYELANLRTNTTDIVGNSVETLRFVKRIGSKYPGNEPPAYSGTTVQEVIRALIDRLHYVDAQIDRTDEVSKSGHVANAGAIRDLRNALRWLEIRAAEERGDSAAASDIFGMKEPELAGICDVCGHILCRRSHEP